MALHGAERIALRREAYDLKEQTIDLLIRVMPANSDAAAALVRARSALFDAWTILCLPPEDDDDHQEAPGIGAAPAR
jgi:hypothetical protein